MPRMLASGDSPAWKRTFFTVWVGQAFSILGSSLVQFALVWWITRTTGSATALATASLVAIVPEVVLGPFAGALVDRWNRRRVMIAADSLTALITLGLVILFLTGQATLAHVYLAMALRSVLGSFHRAAQAASTTLMVPKEQLARIAGLNQSLHGALGIVSPPLGALLMELLPVHWAISVDVLTALLAVVPLLFIDIPQPTRLTAFNAASPVRALLTDVRAGFRFIWSWPGVRGVILLAMGLNLLLSPTFALLPLLVTQHFQGGAMQLGYMDSAWAIGIVVGGLSLSTWGGFRKRTLTAMLGIIGTGLGVALVGFAPMNLLTLALVSMAFGGICNAFCNGSFNAIMQENIPPAMQGRVITVVGSGCMAMMPLGLAVAGPLADATGVRAIWAATGLMQAVMGLAAMLIPTIMNLESNRPADALAQAD